jgi:hypothetical protein
MKCLCLGLGEWALGIKLVSWSSELGYLFGWHGMACAESELVKFVAGAVAGIVSMNPDPAFSTFSLSQVEF